IAVYRGVDKILSFSGEGLGPVSALVPLSLPASAVPAFAWCSPDQTVHYGSDKSALHTVTHSPQVGIGASGSFSAARGDVPGSASRPIVPTTPFAIAGGQSGCFAAVGGHGLVGIYDAASYERLCMVQVKSRIKKHCLDRCAVCPLAGGVLIGSATGVIYALM
ncbi:hypothetical protein KIPB_002560, partial [Kipferlia bialata]